MFYKDNEKDSTYTSWFGNGNIKEQQQYDMGLRIGVFKSFHANGQLFEEVHFDSTGQQNGPSGVGPSGNPAQGGQPHGGW